MKTVWDALAHAYITANLISTPIFMFLTYTGREALRLRLFGV